MSLKMTFYCKFENCDVCAQFKIFEISGEAKGTDEDDYHCLLCGNRAMSGLC